MVKNKRDICSSVAPQISEPSIECLDQRPDWLRSTPARISAAGFIILILMGNLWLVGALLGAQSSPWILTGFALGVASVFVGAITLIIRAILKITQSF